MEKTPESHSEQEKQPTPNNSTPEFKKALEEAERDIYDDPIPDNRSPEFKKIVGGKVRVDENSHSKVAQKMRNNPNSKAREPNNSDSQIKEENLGIF